MLSLLEHVYHPNYFTIFLLWYTEQLNLLNEELYDKYLGDQSNGGTSWEFSDQCDIEKESEALPMYYRFVPIKLQEPTHHNKLKVSWTI